MLRVALVVPSTNLNVNKLVAPLNLCFIASYLRKTVPSAEVKIFDGSLINPIAPLVEEFNPDIIGVTAVTPQAPSAYALLDHFRKTLPNALTVIGGVHVTQLPDEAKPHADCVVIGEGEGAFSDIVKLRMANKQIPPIIEASPIDNLDEIPSPALDLINMKQYLKSPPSVPNLTAPTIGLVTSRGCPWRCTFCWNSARTFKVRYFSAQRIVEDILILRQKYKINSIFFNDDEFLINRKRIEELSILFKQHGIDKWLRWGCQARARTINIPLLKLVKSMGCVVISIGFESACERILYYLKNNSAKVADNEHALELAAQVGVTMGGSFILGTPTETIEEMLQTANWCWNNHNLKYFGFTVLTPYPNTEVWRYCKSKHLLPENVDYERLIPPTSPYDNMLVVATVPLKQFFKTYRDIHRMTWLSLAVRRNPRLKTFIDKCYTPTWWYLWATYPKTMLKTMIYSITKK
jgi:anaerobic magnesium-protoporphyrin IX monomethyl ester cyclase